MCSCCSYVIALEFCKFGCVVMLGVVPNAREQWRVVNMCLLCHDSNRYACFNYFCVKTSETLKFPRAWRPGVC